MLAQCLPVLPLQLYIGRLVGTRTQSIKIRLKGRNPMESAHSIVLLILGLFGGGGWVGIWGSPEFIVL